MHSWWKNKDILTSLLTLAFCWFVHRQILVMAGGEMDYDPVSPEFFPYVLNAGMAILALLLLGRGACQLCRAGRAGGHPDAGRAATPLSQVWMRIMVVALVVLYIAVLDRLGFIVTNSCYLFTTMLLLRVAWKRALIVSIVASVLLWFIFDAFQVVLPVNTIFGF